MHLVTTSVLTIHLQAGETALILAAESGYRQTTEALLTSQKVDVNLVTKVSLLYPVFYILHHLTFPYRYRNLTHYVFSQIKRHWERRKITK